MKFSLYQKCGFISDKIPLKALKHLTSKSFILPFYHTVTDYPKPHLVEIGYFRTKKQFLEDVIFFKKNYDSVSIKKIENQKKNSFHLTFDDGLSEVFTEILPILIQENIDATFFINTDFIDNKEMFYRHKISLILHQLKNSTVELEKISAFLEIENHQVVKEVNSIQDEQQINQIAKVLHLNFKDYLNENQPYLTTKQLLEIKNKGFTIGNHSKNHPNFKDISFEEQKKQINEVNHFLKHELEMNDWYFSFPFGDENIKNELFDFMYNDVKIKYSFGVSGLKNDEHKKHLHRIPMEESDFSAEQIIKFEYFYYVLKSFVNKNKVKR